MMWEAKPVRRHERGEVRERVRFAWLPVRVGDWWVWFDSCIAVERFDVDTDSAGVWVRWTTIDRKFYGSMLP